MTFLYTGLAGSLEIRMIEHAIQLGADISFCPLATWQRVVRKIIRNFFINNFTSFNVVTSKN